MGIYLVVVIFIVPFAAAMYIWRAKTPKRTVYFMISSVSFIALIILVTGTEIMNTFMGLGLFLASTSFFAGAYMSSLLPSRRK
ncbi:MAG: hypothetical protein P8P98_06885 [Emcibacteraceae bacterium]|nr:hypothetical protein [Emcibacteraceae bacterium]MDG1859533.1 hypothetical protein [Emcibacteraceae bacterium]